MNAKQVTVVEIQDPDTGLPVHLAVYKEESGGMVGVDASYVEQDVGPVLSPFGNGVLTLDGEPDELDGNCPVCGKPCDYGDSIEIEDRCAFQRCTCEDAYNPPGENSHVKPILVRSQHRFFFVNPLNEFSWIFRHLTQVFRLHI